jgi:hypothetical protein
MEETLTPLQRLFLAFVAFFAVLFNRRFAEEVKQVRERQRAALPPGPSGSPGPEPAAAAAPAPAPVPEPPKTVPAPVRDDHAEALHMLSLLQRDGRLIDFISEDLAGFSDAEIGAAARTVHEGCRKAIRSYVDLEPVYREAEGASITVAAGFDASAVRLTGNVVGQPPFKGSLRHHGWRATRATFPPPPPGAQARILAPAEVEL